VVGFLPVWCKVGESLPDVTSGQLNSFLAMTMRWIWLVPS